MQTIEVGVKPALLSRRNAAIYLGITTRTIDKLTATGELCKVKLGGKTMLTIADIDRYIERCTEPAERSRTERNVLAMEKQ